MQTRYQMAARCTDCLIEQMIRWMADGCVSTVCGRSIIVFLYTCSRNRRTVTTGLHRPSFGISQPIVQGLRFQNASNLRAAGRRSRTTATYFRAACAFARIRTSTPPHYLRHLPTRSQDIRLLGHNCTSIRLVYHSALLSNHVPLARKREREEAPPPPPQAG